MERNKINEETITASPGLVTQSNKVEEILFISILTYYTPVNENDNAGRLTGLSLVANHQKKQSGSSKT
jgi:hypothetical protein